MKMPAFWLKRNAISWLLWPFSKLFTVLILLRHFAYRRGIFKSYRSIYPVIIVGNISVGGTGKTPLVIVLAQWLKSQGWEPAIVSRGYKSHPPHFPFLVTADMTADIVGDEPLLMAKQAGCPVVIDPQRSRAVKFLEAQKLCNIIISDDGLQHYALARDIEIVVFDHQRQFGNQFLLPAGMLRESITRLAQVDAVVCNGGMIYIPKVKIVYDMHLKPGELKSVNMATENCTLADFKHQKVQAVAGIGNPARFFDLLRKYGLEIQEHAYSDHYVYKATDFNFNTHHLPIIMTEKDAVKCQGLVNNAWYLPVTAILPDAFYDCINKKLRGLHD